MKKIMLTLLLIAMFPGEMTYAENFIDTDSTTVINTATNPDTQRYQTWADFKTQLGSELNLTGVSFGLEENNDNLMWNGTDTYRAHLEGIFAPLSSVVSIISGVSSLGISEIGSGTCAVVVTTTAEGALTTDSIEWSFSADPTAVTGYTPSTAGMLTILVYPTVDNINFKVCNNLADAVTPGAVTLNWRIIK